MDLDYLSEFSEKLIPICVLMGIVVGFMRWLWGISIKKQLRENKDEILREMRADADLRDRAHWLAGHGHQPPPAPMPTWHRPDPNGSGPPDYVRSHRR